MKRPLKNRRIIGPVLDFEAEEVSSTDGGGYESKDDLPDSPMLHEYVDRMVEFTGKPEKAVINSEPVEQYMKRLGVLNG